MRFRPWLIGMLVIMCSRVTGQIYQPEQSILHVNKTPLPPTSASLGTYADYPVDYFSGRIQISIPITNLELDGFEIPVSLSYLPTGLKVMSNASWVGTGWDLLVGGIITRNVNDVPDDAFLQTHNRGFSFSKELDVVTNLLPNPNVTGLKKAYSLMEEVETADNETNAWRLWDLKDKSFPCGGGVGDHFDTEPDNFSYNFLGRSGKFFITPDKQALQAPYTDLKFDFEYVHAVSADMPYSLKKIIVTDEQGVKYYFDRTELTSAGILANKYELNTPHIDPAYSGSSQYAAWYLSKIVLLNAEEINFTYVQEDQYLPYAYQSIGIRNSPDADGNASNNATPFFGNRPQVSMVSSVLAQHTLRLAAIESRLWRVTFTANHNRLDVEGAHALNEIQILAREKGTTRLVKKWDLLYRYHDSRTGNQAPEYPANGLRSQTANVFKRLFLDGIKEYSADGQSNQNYNFTYDESVQLPSPNSVEQDFWGYYNGNSAKTLMPAIGIYHSETEGYKKYSVYHKPDANSGSPLFTLPGANRTPNANYVTKGILTSITYPTGGSLSLEYEANQYSYQGLNYLGPGVRIKKTVQFDGIDHARDIIKEYKYYKPEDHLQSSGIVFNFPAFAYLENTNDYLSPYVEISPGVYYQTPHTVGFPNSYGFNDIRKYQYFLTRLDNPQVISSGLNGDAMGYRNVTVIVNSTYRTEYTFSCPAAFGTISDPVNSTDSELGGAGDNLFEAPSNFICRAPGSYGWSDGCAGGYLQVSANIHSPQTEGMDINQRFAYPFAPLMNYDWNRGLLLQQKEFDDNNKLVKQTTRKYKLFSLNNEGPQYLSALRVGYSENYGLAGINPNTGQPNNYYTNLYMGSKYRVMGNIAKLPEWEEVKTFDASSTSGDYLLQKINFSYLNNSTALKEINYVDSKGQIRKIVNAYPSELAVNGNVYQEMVNRHMISPLLEKTISVDAQGQISEVSKEKVEYDYFANMQILPATGKNANGGAPLETVYTNNLYDLRGNLLQYTGRDGMTVALLYGYNKSKLVAKVINKTYSQVSAVINQAVLDDPASDAAMRTELNSLRLNLGPNVFVTTMTYSPLVGVTSITDENNKSNYYEYDSFGRLELIRDQDNNIVKRFCYNYAGQSESCLATLVYNTEQSASFTRNNCPSGTTGAAYTYVVPANTYAAGSLQDANQLALQDVAKNGQRYANEHGQCLDGGIYVKLRRENFTTAGDYTYGDVIARFYADAACTIPVSVTNLTLNLREALFWEYDGSTVNTLFSYNCTGSVVTIKNQVIVSIFQGDIWTEYYYFLEPGTGYTIVSSTQYPWQN